MHDKLERVHSGPFSNARNVFARVTVRPGRYVIIPSTFEPDCHGKFILRTYSSKGLNLRYDEKFDYYYMYDWIAKIVNYKLIYDWQTYTCIWLIIIKINRIWAVFVRNYIYANCDIFAGNLNLSNQWNDVSRIWYLWIVKFLHET